MHWEGEGAAARERNRMLWLLAAVAALVLFAFLSATRFLGISDQVRDEILERQASESPESAEPPKLPEPPEPPAPPPG